MKKTVYAKLSNTIVLPYIQSSKPKVSTHDFDISAKVLNNDLYYSDLKSTGCIEKSWSKEAGQFL